MDGSAIVSAAGSRTVGETSGYASSAASSSAIVGLSWGKWGAPMPPSRLEITISSADAEARQLMMAITAPVADRLRHLALHDRRGDRCDRVAPRHEVEGVHHDGDTLPEREKLEADANVLIVPAVVA